jgi:pectinesterase
MFSRRREGRTLICIAAVYHRFGGNVVYHAIRKTAMKYINGLSIIILCLWWSDARSGENATVVVAQDGTGKYRSIQQALDAVPPDHEQRIVILVKNGIYNEKLFIIRSNIAVVGEDRDSTRIVYPELRRTWIKDHDSSDWGAATINIDSSATDVTLANLTVHNNYGSLYGDHDHQFAVWGLGTRIIIIHCTIVSDGGDALSLWNKTKGMYYHANCSFEGWVDFVCPRGWCYITDCIFFGHNLSASIWHDGETDEHQKFVIKYSSFDGVPEFPLGRNHLDGQFYLLHCLFSRTMADKPFYRPKSSKRPWKWGDRHFYYNCHRIGGDYVWFADNLAAAAGLPKESDIDARWTFDGQWNPEETMPAVLPTVFLPTPRDAACHVSVVRLELKWIPARNALSQNVYFGKSEKPEFAGNKNENFFQTNNLESGTTYYWRIDEVTETGTIVGPLWHFTTK